MRKPILYALVVVFFLLVFSLAGQSDYEVQDSELVFYSKMVCAGHWPDYDNVKPNCSEEEQQQ